MNHNDVIDFWFTELSPSDWWKKDPAFDQRIKERFGRIHQAATSLELFHWRETAQGCLAEIIVLDQFSRNIYRDTPRAFSSDGIALALAQSAVARGVDQALNDQEKPFLYMPYMHSESLAIHNSARPLFEQPHLEKLLDFEHQHLTIIQQFKRYPHRNAILERESSQAEIDFLKTENSSF